jgi:hypothetical protein
MIIYVHILNSFVSIILQMINLSVKIFLQNDQILSLVKLHFKTNILTFNQTLLKLQ